jgi:hypothetical protein
MGANIEELEESEGFVRGNVEKPLEIWRGIEFCGFE